MLSQFIQNAYDVVVLVILFGVTIFVHEFGHFIVALKCGLIVETFSLGFGPAIWKKKVRGITYKISWIPFGGYVALPQLDPTGMATVQGSDESGDGDLSKNDNVKKLPPVAYWKKILVSVAGAVGNVLFAILLAWVIYLSPSAEVGASSTGIGYVSTNSPAYAQGLRAGDRVVAVNGTSVGTWYRFSEESVLSADSARNVTLTVKYREEERDIEIPLAKEPRGQVIEGIEKAMPCVFGEVTPGGNTAVAGIMVGDFLVNFDGVPVTSTFHLLRMVKGRDGEVVSVVLRRGDEDIECDVRLPLGDVERAGGCLVGKIVKASPAAAAGLKERDVVKEFDGVSIIGWPHLCRQVAASDGVEVEIVVKRKGREINLLITPEFNEKYKKMVVGIQEGYIPVFPWMRYKEPMAQVKSDASGIMRILDALTTPEKAGNAAKALGGPVMIVRALWVSIKISIFNAVGFLRFLNINLAILNLLPIPVLDGGHIVLALWEWITRRKVHPKIINALVNAFAVLLIGSMLLITFRDIFGPLSNVKKFFSKDKPTADVITNTVPDAVTNVLPDVLEE
ncbi:MAG: site-2 protease family protein [Kiritimatiellae bacterium]|nr:site-2 protease family protein [Kiritimatiellia bacterium]